MNKYYILFFLSTILFGCGISEKEHSRIISERDSLLQVVDILNKEIDKLENGEERLMNLINFHVENNEYLKAYECLNSLKNNHPESPLMKTNAKLFSSVETKGAEILKAIEKAKRDSTILANINNLGDWVVGNYVNHFDEPTGKKYVVADFYGTFSNSATAASELRIRIKADKDYYEKDKFSVTLKFDEYDNGTYEDETCQYSRIVNKEFRKIYTQEYAYGGYKDENGKSVSLEEILEEESDYEFYMSFKYGTKYSFNINTKYFNNALIKAGIKKIGD